MKKQYTIEEKIKFYEGKLKVLREKQAQQQELNADVALALAQIKQMLIDIIDAEKTGTKES